MEILIVIYYVFIFDVFVCNFFVVFLNRKYVYVFEIKMEIFEKERIKKILKFKVKRGFIKFMYFIR